MVILNLIEHIGVNVIKIHHFKTPNSNLLRKWDIELINSSK